MPGGAKGSEGEVDFLRRFRGVVFGVIPSSRPEVEGCETCCCGVRKQGSLLPPRELLGVASVVRERASSEGAHESRPRMIKQLIRPLDSNGAFGGL